MDDDVIVIYDEIEEEPEQFTSQNYEYMLAQALLTREAIQEKLRDPSENSNFQFIGSATHNNSIWDNFLAITYGGVEQNFFKCRDCNEIFDKDPQKSLGQLRNHNCKTHIDREDEESRRPNRATTNSIKNSEKVRNFTRQELAELYQNPKERKYLVTKQKSNFKCFAWQFLDVVFYKGQKQQFARCRHCEALVTYSNKNGTSSIRKHALRCQEILRVKRNLGKQGSKSMNVQSFKDELKCDSSSDKGSELDSSLVPQVEIYSDEEDDKYKVHAKINKTNKDILTCAQLKKMYITNKESKYFLFKKPKNQEQKNSVWNWFDEVYYKDIKQECYKCSLCDALISGVDKNELAVHINNHNAKNTNVKKASTNKKEKISETMITDTKSKSHLKKQIPLNTKTETFGDVVTDVVVEDTVAVATNQMTTNLIDFVISSAGQTLNLIEDVCFRTFVQGLISLGAKYGERNANDFLPTVDSILKNSIPLRVRTLKTEIKEMIADEPHLSISVDLIKDTSPRSNGVSYFTVKVHVITKCFTSRVFVLGAREIREQITEETLKEEFLSIMKEYIDTHELHSRCILVLNEKNELLVKAFANYTRLPSVTHSLESIVNKVLLVEDAELNICDTVIKIQELFEHITVEHNYSMSKGECLLDLLEEFYEMNKPIEKLLKYTRPCSVDHSALSDVSKHTVKTILNGFQVIKLCVDTIRQNQVTLNGILLWKKKLVEQYSPVLYEHRLNARLKFHTLEQIQTTFIVDDPIYKIALFLNPNFKNLKFLSEKDRQEVFNGIKEMFLNKFYDRTKSNEETEEIDKEINKYFVTKNLDCSNEDLLEFWKKITIFPRLKIIARHILSIPGTSDGVSEDVFQKANRSLANGIGTSVDFSSIIFLHSNSGEDYTYTHA